MSTTARTLSPGASDSVEAPDARREVEVLQSVIQLLEPMGTAARSRILEATSSFLRIGLAVSGSAFRDSPTPTQGRGPSFSADLSMSPKEFMLEKQPRTDVERLACLAFYLTHYRDQPSFKTLDLSKLNTEAAQPRFSNAANTAMNAVKLGYLVPSSKGQRQLSAAGERFVLALPDRAAAKDAMTSMRPRRRAKRPRPSSAATV